MTREKYESLPLATLKELAKARKMRGVSTLKKGDLIDAMLELDEQEEQKEAAEEAREEVKEEKKEDNVVSFSDDVFPEKNEMHTVKMPDMFSENTVSEKPQGLDKIDFEKQLEESLKDL